jgi:hypothetical protein
MTTLAQPGLAHEPKILKTLVHHNRHDLLGAGKFPCAGVYAVVENAGNIRVSDFVVLKSDKNSAR